MWHKGTITLLDNICISLLANLTSALPIKPKPALPFTLTIRLHNYIVPGLIGNVDHALRYNTTPGLKFKAQIRLKR